MKKGVKYDYKEAYNKNLKPSARLHYLENARHDKDSPAKMGHKSPAKKYGSPMKMGGHAIHKHMGSALHYGQAKADLDIMPIDNRAASKKKLK